MKNTDLKVGDLVKLKSGSIEMTVTSIAVIDNKYTDVIVTWWDEEIKDFVSVNFNSNCLVLNE